MRDDRRNDADQIDIFALHQAAPIILDVGNAEFARDCFRTLAMRAGDRDNLRALAILERGNLR